MELDQEALKEATLALAEAAICLMRARKAFVKLGASPDRTASVALIDVSDTPLPAHRAVFELALGGETAFCIHEMNAQPALFKDPALPGFIAREIAEFFTHLAAKPTKDEVASFAAPRSR